MTGVAATEVTGRLANALLIGLALAAFGCGKGYARAGIATVPAASPAEVQIVTGYIDAFNRQDIPGMLALAHPDIVWLSLVDDSVTVESRGADALARQLAVYFRSHPDAASTARSVTRLGRWVTAHETMTWSTSSGVARSQSALAVYEVRAERVQRVWYYPVVR
jgi:hypothetical protein